MAGTGQLTAGILLLQLMTAAVAAPDPGIWSFNNVSSEDNYIGVVKNVYADTKLFIRVKCSAKENFKVKVGWMLRKTPCWEEYLALDMESHYYANYYNKPAESPYNEAVYSRLVPNYTTVQYVKPKEMEFTCDSLISLDTFVEAQPQSPGEVAADEAVPPAPSPDDAAAAAGLQNRLVNLNTLQQRAKRQSQLNPDKPQYVIKHEGVYLLVVYIGGVSTSGAFRAALDIQFLSPSGYLSVTDWPLLPFYGIMCGVYVLMGLLWLIFCSIHWRDILRLQFWIGGVIFLGMVEKAMFTSEYQNINTNGQTTQGLIISAEIISCAKRSIARMLVIIVSLGFGIVKPRLGPTLNKVVGIGGIYFILASVESVFRVVYPKNDPSNATLLAAVPLAVIDASICWWVFSALIQTTRALRLRRNLVKLSVYKHFTNTLVFAVFASIIFMLWSIKYHKVAECLTEWRDLWVDEAFWHLLFSVILLVIMVLWRPSQNNQRYAFTPLLDGEEDYSSDEEDVLYNDAWDGMKMRGKTTSRPDTPSGADPEEDPLAWVEENIAGVGAALPALDSEEEIETTKIEISKMN